MKICSTCNEPKGLKEFFKDSASPDGLKATCKRCVKKRRDREGRDAHRYESIVPEGHGHLCVCGKLGVQQIREETAVKEYRFTCDRCRHTTAWYNWLPDAERAWAKQLYLPMSIL